jgi:acyl-CoA reductase-like NAD-dependent aldehyde dehydrogenase
LISSTLELSGCDALFLLDDGDAELAARATWFGTMLNRGQTCLAVRRAFVPRSLYGDFCGRLGRLSAAGAALTLALPAQGQQAERLVQAALDQGGRLLSPPRSAVANGQSAAFQPAIIADARPEMALCREASFAPVLAVLPYDTPEQALEMDGQCSYALGASIFTRSPSRASALAAQLRSGAVAVNDVIVPTAHPGTPLGGRADSGWGVTQGAEGLLEMTVPQVVSLRTDTFRPHYDLVNEGAAVRHLDLASALLQSSHAATFGQRFRGWLRLARALWNLR